MVLVEVQLLQVVLWPEEVAAAELQLMKLVLSFLASFASSAFLKLLLLFSLSQSPSSTEPFAEVRRENIQTSLLSRSSPFSTIVR